MYKNRKNNRLQKYDYSQCGYYFITICTKDKRCFFGNIEDGEIMLNEYGKISEEYWKKIPDFYNDIELDEFIVMPNHIHGILINHNVGTEQCSVPTNASDGNVGTEQCSVRTNAGNNNVGTGHRSVRTNVSTVIMSFKGVVTKKIKRTYNDDDFGWHRSYYDHVIRKSESLDKIREYVHFNAQKWDLDSNNPKNLAKLS